MRPTIRLSLCLALASVSIGSQAVQAQYYGDERGQVVRRTIIEERVVPPPPPRYRERSGGLNCDAVQDGITGLHPFSCPLPGPRPLGARCFCNTPVALFSGGQTVAGRVVP